MTNTNWKEIDFEKFNYFKKFFNITVAFDGESRRNYI